MGDLGDDTNEYGEMESQQPTEELGSVNQGLAGGSTTFTAATWGLVDDAIGILGNGCTGTLISRNTVLTAAHCVCDDNGPNANLSTCDATATFRLDSQTTAITGTVVPHPQFGQSHWLAYDYAVIRLDTPITAVPPVAVSAETPKVGDTVWLTGYGTTGADCTTAVDGNKRNTSLSVSAVTEDWDFKTSNTSKHLCPGDSGGPVLAGSAGALRVIGVNSWGDHAANSVFKPTHLVWDWIKEHSGPRTLPQNTWGECVFYDTVPDGAYLSVRNASYPNLATPATGIPNWNDRISSVWVRKGYSASIYTNTNYGGTAKVVDGYNGAECNEFGCLHTLTGTSSNTASSAKCLSALPGNTWGKCVFYGRYGDGGYVSIGAGNVDFTSSNTWINNKITNVWVKRGQTAKLYSKAGYAGNITTLSGYSGTWCNTYGCMHNLENAVDDSGTRMAGNTATSASCTP